MKKFDIYGLGAALVDTELEVSDQDLLSMGVEKGLMTLVDEARQEELLKALEDRMMQSKRASGGSAGNTIIAANYFGSKTFFSGRVANDDNGHFYLKDMELAGVKTVSASEEPGVTGKCLILITPDAERSMNTFLGASEKFSTQELDFEAIGDSSYLYIESYLVTSESGKDAAIKARQHAQSHSTKVALSFSDPGIVQHFKTGIDNMIGERIDLIFCNKDEALAYTGADSVEQAIEQIHQVADEVVVTLGAEGALLSHNDSLIKIEGTAVEAVDTNGAGDMFAGAYLYGISVNLPREACGELASRAAAKVVSQFGPRLNPDQYQDLIS